MKNLALLFAFIFSFSTIYSQTYFYLEEVTVTPVNPTNLDTIKVKIEGNKSTPCVMLESLELTQQGQNFEYVFKWFELPGICLTVLEPWDTTLSLFPLEPGNNCVEIINVSLGSSDTTEVCFEVTSTNSSEEASVENQFLLYPNPAKHLVNWQLPNTSGQEHLFYVSDLLGREVMQFKSTANAGSINVEGWGTGLYFLTGHFDGVQKHMGRFQIK